MPCHLVFKRILLQVESRQSNQSHLHSGRAVRTAHEQLFRILVKTKGLADEVSVLRCVHFLDHPDVPNFDHSIGIARSHQLAADTKSSIVDRIQVAVESLHRQACAHVPDRHRPICRPGDEEVGKRLEIKSIHGVRVRPKLLSNLETVQVEQLDRTVLRPREHKVPGIVELSLPDHSSVAVGERVRDARVYEVPNFYALVSTCSHQVRTRRVKVNAGDPLAVAFSRHNIVSILHIPDLPGAIITGGSNNLLAHMQRKAADGLLMRFDGLALHRRAWVDVLGVFSQERVGSGVFGEWSVFAFHWKGGGLVGSGSGLFLLSVCLFNLMSDSILLALDLLANNPNPLRQLILLELE